jgi:ubiquinone biosynthesis protein
MHAAIKTLKIARIAATVPLYPWMPSKRGYASWLRRETERAGCLYVKIGQWVSSRTDIFPPEITDEFAALRSGSASMSPDAMMAVVRPETFDAFDPIPISTGSIAQVHRGTLDGRDVAIKIQRPGLLQQLIDDTDAVKFVLSFFRGSNAKMVDDMGASLDDLIDTVRRELDFEAEADHMRRFHDFFETRGVKIPRVMSASPRVIVMEFVDAAPYRGPTVALMELFFRQFFELGWLHTDMHAGNVGQTPDGTLVVFDFGSVLEIPDDVRLCIKSLMVSYLNRDVSVMLEYMLEYGVLRGSPDSQERAMLESFLENVLEYVEITDAAQFARVMKTVPIPQSASPNTTFRPELFVIMRSFTLMEGLCKTLDPDFVILDAVAPLAASFANDPMMARLKIEDDLRVTFKNMNSSFGFPR